MTTTRRTFLTSTLGVAAAGLTAATAAGPAAADVGIQAQQPDWHYCEKCHCMFFNGYANKGNCPVRGSQGHLAQGWMFLLPYNFPSDGNHQPQWRYCGKCKGMFWDGNANKGICPAGGVHAAEGWEFTLPHDFSQVPIWSQPGWRFCAKCWILFFEGRLGPCPGGGWLGGHDPRGSFNFMLPYQP
jgi:hypothetical protein